MFSICPSYWSKIPGLRFNLYLLDTPLSHAVTEGRFLTSSPWPLVLAGPNRSKLVKAGQSRDTTSAGTHPCAVSKYRCVTTYSREYFIRSFASILFETWKLLKRISRLKNDNKKKVRVSIELALFIFQKYIYMTTALPATLLLCGHHLLKMKSNNMHHIFLSSPSDDIFKDFFCFYVH